MNVLSEINLESCHEISHGKACGSRPATIAWKRSSQFYIIYTGTRKSHKKSSVGRQEIKNLITLPRASPVLCFSLAQASDHDYDCTSL